jgi:TolB-like protein/DNA-binding winged helix-turn-helix (wHTH) protein/Flp pilus assembly protein TadD
VALVTLIDCENRVVSATRDDITLSAVFPTHRTMESSTIRREEQWMAVRDATGAMALSPRVVLAHELVTYLGALTISPALRQIVHVDGRDEVVEPKVMEVLVVLLRAEGGILTRDELCAAAWDGRIVGDDAINRVLARLRRLSEGIGTGVFRIETITKVGYRLVRMVDGPAAMAGPPPRDSDPLAAYTVAPPVASMPAPLLTFPQAVAPVVAAPATLDARAPTAAQRPIARRVMIGGSVALAAVAGVVWRLLPRAEAAADSVAVLPFANLSGDPAQAYFSDGIAEELRSALTRIVRLKVAARSSSELMRAADVPTAAAKLGVANVVTGSVRHGGGTIRVSAQLVDGTTGLTRWSDTYDRIAGDVLAIETGIAENVASALNIVLGRAEKALLAAGSTSNPVARDAFLRGSALEAAQKPYLALPEYAAAIAADPSYALALAGHASISCWLAMEFTTQPAAALAIAAAEARRAVALAPGLGTLHGILAFIRYAQLDFREARAGFATAVRLAPNDAFLLGRYSIYLDAIGKGAEAVRVVERAQRLDPLRPNGPLLLGWALYFAGRYGEAVTTLRTAVTRLPDDIEGRSGLAMALIAADQPAEALKMARTIAPGVGFREVAEAIALAKLGDRAGSDRVLDGLRTMNDFPYEIATIESQRGEVEAAFASLDLAVAGHEVGIGQLKGDPMMRPLRGDPRFAVLVRRIGFP